jgi:hypothetical protein
MATRLTARPKLFQTTPIMRNKNVFFLKYRAVLNPPLSESLLTFSCLSPRAPNGNSHRINGERLS